jgi:hypothetical protein
MKSYWIATIIINLGTKLKLVVLFTSRRSGEERDHGIRFKGAWARFGDEKKRKFFSHSRNQIRVK